MKVSVMKNLAIVSALFIITACSSLPPELENDSTNLVTNYSQFAKAQATKNKPVRLGGVVAKVTNLPQQTRLEIVNLPIDSTGRPDIKVDPKGRFVAYVPEFLDPVTYAAGRLVTVMGISAAPELGVVGEYQYQFPVIQATGHHLWQVETITISDADDFYSKRCRPFGCNGFYLVHRGFPGKAAFIFKKK